MSYACNRDVRTQGFTIVELIVAMTIFSVVVVSFVSLLTSIQYSQRTTKYLDIAKNAAISKMEGARSNPASLVDGPTSFTSSLPDGLPAGSTGTVTVSPATNVLDMKNVEVEVRFRYPHEADEKVVKINSVVGEKGIVK